MRVITGAAREPGRRAGRRRRHRLLCMIAIFAMVVLTVDVGGLLLERRSMVNAADAAALAAAQSCANQADTSDPEAKADEFAKQNVTDLPADGIDNITEIVGCHTTGGHVTVHYQEQHPLFFAAILPGNGSTGTVASTATASWGPLAGGFAIPIVLQTGYLQGTCKVPDGIEIGDTCAFWYDNKDTMGSANWGFMNLDQWNVSPGEHCSNAGSSSRSDWIANGYPDLRTLNGAPPGSAPTYVCNDTGHSTRDWSDLSDEDRQGQDVPGQRLRRPARQDRLGRTLPRHARQVRHHRVHLAADPARVQGQRRGRDRHGRARAAGAARTCRAGRPAFDADGDVVEPPDDQPHHLRDVRSRVRRIQLERRSSPRWWSRRRRARTTCCARPGSPPGCQYTYNATTKTIQWIATGTKRTGSKESRRRPAHLVQLAERGHARCLRGSPLGSERDLPGDGVAGIHHGTGPGRERRRLRPVRDRAVRSGLLRRLPGSGLNLR